MTDLEKLISILQNKMDFYVEKNTSYYKDYDTHTIVRLPKSPSYSFPCIGFNTEWLFDKDGNFITIEYSQ